MAHFHGLCRMNCDLKHIGGILELSKLDFRRLKGQFDVKKANLRGLKAKNSYLWPILAYRTHPGSVFLDCATELWLKGY